MCRSGLVLALVEGSLLTVLPAAAQGVPQRQLNDPFPLVPAEDAVALAYGPGGTRIAYWVHGGAGSTLYCRAADGSGFAAVLASTSPTAEPYGAPRFLSGGARILFASLEDERVRVFTVPSNGSAAPFEPIGSAVLDFQLTSDEASLVFRDDAFTADRFDLLSVPLAGGSATVLNGPLRSDGDVEQFTLSADGTRAVYWGDEVAGDGIYSALVGVPGSAVNLDAGTIPFQSFQLTADSARVVYLGHPGVRIELFSALVDGSAPPAVISFATAPSFASVEDFQLSPDGAWVVFRADRFVSVKDELFAVPAAGGVEPIRLNAPMPNTRDVAYGFRISPDSARVVWRADAAVLGRLDLFSAPIDGSGPAVSLATPASAEEDVNAVLLFDPSGARVAFASGWTSTSTQKLLSVPTDGSSAPVLLDDLVSEFPFPPFEVTLDGTRIVYTRSVGDGQQLRVARLDGLAAPLTLGAGDYLSAHRVSPDGTHVAFIADQDVDTVDELFTRRLDAGAPALELGHPFAPAVQAGGVHSFVAGARRVLFVADQDASGAIGLFSAPLRASEQPLRISDTTLGPIDVAASTAVQLAAGETRAVYRGRFGERERLFSSTVDHASDPIVVDAGGQPRASISSFQVRPDGQSVVFVSDHDTDEAFELYGAALTAAGSPVKLSGALVAGGDVLPGFQITSDGARVVYVADQDTNDVFELYAATGSGAPVKLSGVLPANSDVEPDILLSPDGARVFFRGDLDTDGRLELFSAPTDGSSARVKISGTPIIGTYVIPGFRVTPDGAHVLFAATLSGPFDMRLYRADKSGANPPVLLSTTPGDYEVSGILVDPTGTRAVYWAEDANQFHQALFSVPIAGGTPVQLTHNAPFEGNVSDLGYPGAPPGFQITPDGTRVLYLFDPLFADDSSLHVVPIDGSSPAVRLSPSLPGAEAFAFRVDPRSESALYLTGFASGIELYRVPLDLSRPARRLTREPSDGEAGLDFGFAPDGTALYRFDPFADSAKDLFEAFEDAPPSVAPAATPTVFRTKTL